MNWTIIADVVYKKKILLAGGGATQPLSCKIYITDLVYAKIRFGHALYHSKFLRKTAASHCIAGAWRQNHFMRTRGASNTYIGGSECTGSFQNGA